MTIRRKCPTNWTPGTLDLQVLPAMADSNATLMPLFGTFAGWLIYGVILAQNPPPNNVDQ